MDFYFFDSLWAWECYIFNHGHAICVSVVGLIVSGGDLSSWKLRGDEANNNDKMIGEDTVLAFCWVKTCCCWWWPTLLSHEADSSLNIPLSQRLRKIGWFGLLVQMDSSLFEVFTNWLWRKKAVEVSGKLKWRRYGEFVESGMGLVGTK